MSRLLHFAATAALACASSGALAQFNDCDAEITRERTRAEMSCQQQFGPLSGRLPDGKWHPGASPALDRCLNRVNDEYRLERWACHGVVFNDARLVRDY